MRLSSAQLELESEPRAEVQTQPRARVTQTDRRCRPPFSCEPLKLEFSACARAKGIVLYTAPAPAP